MNINAFHSSLNLTELTFTQLQNTLVQISEQAGLVNKFIQVSARTLTPVEAIGDPDRKDFPLVKGREVMLEANLGSAIGQAFTDMPSEFTGTIQDICELPLNDNAERGVFVATLNAVLRFMNCIGKTIHCKDEEPEECARNLPDHIQSLVPEPRIAFIGMQPAMVEYLSTKFPIRVTDNDPDNVGQKKYGLTIESSDKTKEVIDWSNIVLATGSTLVNNTFSSLLRDKPVVFYGVTATGIAFLTGNRHFCYNGH